MNISQLTKHLDDPLYRNSIYLIGNNIVATGFGFFFWMVVARYYSEYEVGVGSAIISAIMFLSLLCSLGLNVAIIRFLARSKKPVEMINTCFMISGIAAVIASGIFLAGVDIWSPVTHFVRDNVWFALAFVLFVVVSSISRIIDSVFVARRRAEFTMMKSSLFSLLKIPLPIILARIWHSFGIVSSWGFASFIALAISFIFFMPRIQPSYRPVPKLNLSIIRPIWKYAIGNYFAALFTAAPGLILPIIIVNLLSPTDNAYFYVSWTIAHVLFAIPGAAAQSLFAEASHAKTDLAAISRRAFKFIVFLLVPAVILMIILGKWLLLLFGENYSSNGLTLLWILAASSLFAGINSVYYSILRIRGRIKELMLIRFLMAIAALIAASLIAPIYGIVGIGYAWIGTKAIATIYVLFIVRLRYRALQTPNDSG